MQTGRGKEAERERKIERKKQTESGRERERDRERFNIYVVREVGREKISREVERQRKKYEEIKKDWDIWIKRK